MLEFFPINWAHDAGYSCGPPRGTPRSPPVLKLATTSAPQAALTQTRRFGRSVVVPKKQCINHWLHLCYTVTRTFHKCNPRVKVNCSRNSNWLHLLHLLHFFLTPYIYFFFFPTSHFFSPKKLKKSVTSVTSVTRSEKYCILPRFEVTLGLHLGYTCVTSVTYMFCVTFEKEY